MSGEASVSEHSVIRVMIVDAHPVVRDGLAARLRCEPDLQVVGKAGSSDQALELATSCDVDVATLPVWMDGMSGICLAGELARQKPACRVLGFSMIEDPAVIASMLHANARSFALKTQPLDEVVDAIRQTAAGHRYLPPALRPSVESELAEQPRCPLDRLSRREREIFGLMVRGHSNHEIAQHLFISPRTAETHRHRVMHKLSAHSIADLLRVAARWGQLHPEITRWLLGS